MEVFYNNEMLMKINNFFYKLIELRNFRKVKKNFENKLNIFGSDSDLVFILRILNLITFDNAKEILFFLTH